MKIYIECTNKDSSGNSLYEFIDPAKVEINGIELSKIFDNINKDIKNLKDNTEKTVADLKKENKELKAKMIELVKVTLEVTK